MTIGTDALAPELVTQALGRLLEVGPHDLEYWQWLTLPILLLAAWAFGSLLSRSTRFVLGRIAARTEPPWDDELVRRMGAPITAAWTVIVAWLLLPALGLTLEARDSVHSALRGSFFLVVFWAVARSINIAAQIIGQSHWAKSSPASRTLLPLGARVLQLLLLAIAVVALLSDLGYPVASLLAGLGIGGVAIALAAQKTVENLLGAFSIGADQPFREGDTIRVDGIEGTVEKVGLRSTRIRTADRTLVSMPNGRLSEMRIESLAPRDRIRLTCNLALRCDTHAEHVRKILAQIEDALRAHSKIWPHAMTVCLKELGEYSLNVEIAAWFSCDVEEFTTIRQDMLLRFMEIVEGAGSSLAFPTRTVHVISERAP